MTANLADLIDRVEPCPYCSSRRIKLESWGEIWCLDCPAEMHRNTPEHALTAWNARSATLRALQDQTDGR